MPLSWMPEGTTILATSDEQRTLAKWCQLLFDANGDMPSPFPEGCAPRPGDDELRLTQKINALQQ